MLKPNDFTGDLNRENRAVSPVIGVILMVAITVILAAVIGAFVLEIGDQQETAPNSSFESEERIEFTTNGNNPPKNANLTTVYVTHAGGDTLQVNQFDLVVDGNDSVYGFSDNELDPTRSDLLDPQPDIFETAGTNEPITFESGQELNAVVYEGLSDDNILNTRSGYTTLDVGPIQNCWEAGNNDIFANRVELNPVNVIYVRALPLQQDDEVSIKWTASSGGKTQRLFKYNVQNSFPDPTC
jgi:flagellin-like protein